jgi:hypothetical protein
MWNYVEALMKNVTLAFEETFLDNARALSERRRTTLNALIRSLLAQEMAQEARVAEAKRGLKELMDRSSGRFEAGFKFNRQEIYDEREAGMLSRHEHPDLRRDGQTK